MPDSPPNDEQDMKETEAIVGALEDHANRLWGAQRAAELREAIQSTAANIAGLRKALPPLSEEPGFYLS